MSNTIAQFQNRKRVYYIKAVCRRWGIDKYTINDDSSIDVEGDVVLPDSKMTQLPISFNKVSGDFDCSVNHLITLDGCPVEVGGIFNCLSNNLTSFKGAPKIVGGRFFCNNNVDLPPTAFIHLFELGYDGDKIIADLKFNLKGLYRQWVLTDLLDD